MPMSTQDSKAQAIRTLYRSAGGMMSLGRLARLAIQSGIWSDEEQHNMLFSAVKIRCKNAIKALDLNGLPIAGESKAQTQDGEKLWLQLDLWNYDDAVHNLAIRIRGTWKDQAATEKLAEWTKTRFGTVPPIPRLDYPDDEPLWWNDGFDDEDEEGLEDSEE